MTPLSLLDMELSPISLSLLQIYIIVFLNKVFFTILKSIRMHLFIYLFIKVEKFMNLMYSTYSPANTGILGNLLPNPDVT